MLSQGDTKFSAQNVTELREKVFKAGWLMLADGCVSTLCWGPLPLLPFRRSNP